MFIGGLSLNACRKRRKKEGEGGKEERGEEAVVRPRYFYFVRVPRVSRGQVPGQ